MVKVVQSDQNKVKLQKKEIVLETIDKNISKLVENWYLQNTEKVFNTRLGQLCKKFNIENIPKLTTRKMSKRWGSFVQNTKIILNPELIKAPKECIDYVITHELCHFTFKNHSKEFFKLLTILCPKWQKIKEELEIRMNNLS
jgi:predicted metal-dependent hydrolase